MDRILTMRGKPVHLVIMGDIDGIEGLSIEKLREYVAVFYPGLDVELLPPISIELEDEVLSATYTLPDGTSKKKKLAFRKAHPYDLEFAQEDSLQVPSTNSVLIFLQIKVDPLLNILTEVKPRSSACLLGVTMEDLFEGAKDSFVVGMANGGSHVGVFSFARYDLLSIQIQRLMLQRQCWPELVKYEVYSNFFNLSQVLVHELAHIFGLGHCTFFSCCMVISEKL
jgi:predicted Zn-dependent protease